jgi:L-histidine Nalpha-methyltransferase
LNACVTIRSLDRIDRRVRVVRSDDGMAKAEGNGARGVRTGAGAVARSLTTVDAFFESPLHERDVVNGIISGTLPLKYAYTGSAARTHDLLARSDGYLNVIGSAVTEADTVAGLAPHERFQSALVEIGPGNGAHTTALLTRLRARGTPIRRYLGLDFSSTLLAICQGRLLKTFVSELSVDTGVWDIETAPSPLLGEWRESPDPIIVALFGQTLGNVESVVDTLSNIHESMVAGDVLIVTITLLRDGEPEDEILAPYRTSVFLEAVLEPMRAAGVAADQVDLRVTLADSTVIGEAVLRAPVELAGCQLGAGHTVRCFLSRRFDATQVPNLFDRTHWSCRPVVIDDDGRHAVVVGMRLSGVG